MNTSKPDSQHDTKQQRQAALQGPARFIFDECIHKTTPAETSENLAVYEACNAQYPDKNMALAATVGFFAGVAYSRAKLSCMAEFSDQT